MKKRVDRAMTKAELAENQWTLPDKRKRERVAVELKFSTRLVANTRLTAGVTLLVARGAPGCKKSQRERERKSLFSHIGAPPNILSLCMPAVRKNEIYM